MEGNCIEAGILDFGLGYLISCISIGPPWIRPALLGRRVSVDADSEVV